MAKIALGTKEMLHPDFARSVLAELLLTFLFVFTGAATSIAAERMTGSGDTVMGLMATAAANAMLVAVTAAVGLDVSAGHLNPAVTIGFAAGGYVSVIRCVLYVAVQLAGSSLACLLIEYITGLVVPVHALGSGLSPAQGAMMEVVLTFSMVFSVYAVIVDPKKGVVSSLAPLLVGLIVGANTLAGGPFSGASMNPARSFGPAFANWNWADQWVYWAGPLVGSGLAGIVYSHLYQRSDTDFSHDEEEAFYITTN